MNSLAELIVIPVFREWLIGHLTMTWKPFLTCATCSRFCRQTIEKNRPSDLAAIHGKELE